MSQTKPNGRVEASLDTRIASLLRSEDADRESINSLWAEALEEHEHLKALISTESERLMDLQNEDPEGSRQAIEAAKLRAERLCVATRRFKVMIGEMNGREAAQAWSAEHDAVIAEREKLIARFLDWAVPTIKELAAFCVEVETFDRTVIGNLHSSAPPGEHRRLRTVELEAYDLNNFTEHAPSIMKLLRLPDPASPSRVLYPHDVLADLQRNAALQTAALQRALQAKGALPIEEVEGETAEEQHARVWAWQDEQRAAEQAEHEKKERERQDESLAAYHAHQRRAEEARRTGVRPNGNGSAP